LSIEEKELTLARRISWKIGSKWSAVEVEDLTQELTLWLFENVDTVKRYRNEEGGDAKLFVTLRRVASKYCAHEQQARSGARLDAGATYSLGQIERALPFLWEETPQTAVHEHEKTSGFSGDYGRAVAVMTDIRGAYASLPQEVRSVLALRFRDGLSYYEIGTLTSMSDRGVKKRVTRALTRIQEALGGAYDGLTSAP